MAPRRVPFGIGWVAQLTAHSLHVSFVRGHPMTCYLGCFGEITEHRWEGLLLGSSVRSSGEFGIRLTVSVLVGSQNSLPDISNIQNDNLGVVEWVKSFGKVRYLWTKAKVGPLHHYGVSKDDINGAFNRHMINHVMSGITTRLACKSSTRCPEELKPVGCRTLNPGF